MFQFPLNIEKVLNNKLIDKPMVGLCGSRFGTLFSGDGSQHKFSAGYF